MFIHEQNDKLDFLDEVGEDLKITQLLDKYEIKTSDSFLYDVNDDFKALLDYISELYFEDKKIPKDIVYEINTNINFKAFIVSAIEKKMKNILYDSTTIIFKEIVTIIDILSFGTKYDIFESYNKYNLNNLAKLFKEYENKLKELKDTNTQDFEITFMQYTILIEVINELCAINSMDLLRKKTISPLMEVISETINLVKYNISLDEEKINILNNILGKLLFYYSHVPYINSKNKDSQYLIDEFTFNFEKICNGYELSKMANFANEKNTAEYYKIFLNSVSTLILTLIYKLENNYELKDYEDISRFEEIITLYEEKITHEKIGDVKSLNELKQTILKNYAFIFDATQKPYDYQNIIDSFLEDSSFSSAYMYLLHSLVLFSNELEDEKLMKILKKLISQEKYKNDYHEFLKLNICDVIITKFINENREDLDELLINNIIDYIRENKIASHLMAIYSKIYLTLSLYYSYNNDFISNDKSKLYYFYYVKINGYELLENEYDTLNKSILMNHGKKYILDLELENVLISDSKCVEVGKKILNNFFVEEEINQKYNINQKLSNIITKIFTNEGLNDDTLNKHIENFISNDIFHGLTFVAIEGLCKNECSLIDLGYERIDIPLFDQYKLKIAYSKVYKYIFEKIYETNKSYIKQNIINLIICYLKSIPIYKDIVTGLNNQEKLKLDLLKKDDDLVFVEFYVNDLVDLNKRNSYEKVNEYFKEYAQKVNSIVNIYRLNGPRFAFFLNKKDNINLHIETIKGVEIVTNDENIRPTLTIGVSWGNRENIVEKSNLCLNLAHENKDKYYEFK